MAAIIAIGAAAGFGQDACTDADGQTTLGDKFRAEYALKDIPGRKQAIETGKQFLEKYGSCDSAKELSEYLKKQIPVMDANLIKLVDGSAKTALLKRFDDSMKAKNWDETYASGKEILAKYPAEFSAVELVLGSIGYDELMDRKNGKYSDQTMSFAKQSLADLEAGKEFKPGFGVSPFVYKSKEDAVAWMNVTIGSIYYVGQKNKQAALPYLYKATMAPTSSDVSKNPNPYEFIGSYYFDELNKVIEKIQLAAKDQKDTDTPDVVQKKISDIKALVAQSNGISERAMDAYSRAYTLGKDPAYKAAKKQNVTDAYKLRFNKTDGVDAWIAAAVAKPFINPTTPVAPVSDPEPVVAPATTTTPVVTPVKPGITPVKPPVSAPIKPVKTPGTKPQAVVKKPIVKKKGA